MMANNQIIDFKDPMWITTWLDTALKKEKEKYEKCPVMPDLLPGHEEAQGWGYVVTGYFLVEKSFKALLFVRGKHVPAKHSLSILFNLLDDYDKEIIREYFTDYRATIGGKVGAFPFKTLDDFLINLDGDQNQRGDHIGSYDWRYFLIEEKRSQKMPIVSVDYLHEIVYGCIQIVEYVRNGQSDPSKCTHSWRMRWKRENKYRDWLLIRANSDGWDDIDDRLEILWGPDYKGRYDLYHYRGKGVEDHFCDIPHDFSTPIIDKRTEVETFDVNEGFRRIGMTRVLHPSTN